MRVLITLLLCAASLFGQVTVTMASPQNGEQIAQIYSPGARGGALSSAGSITSVTLYLDGSIFTAASGTSTWSAVMDVRSTAAGPHTVFARATDSMGNTGDSPTVNITIAHSNPVCSHTNVVGSIYCEQAPFSVVAAASTTLGLTGPFTAGQVAIVYGFFSLPVLQQGSLGSGINAMQTSITVNDTCGGCTWPATPFNFVIDSEKLTVTTRVGTAWTVVRGVSGLDCIPAGTYPNNAPNTPLINGGAPQACGAAASHLAGAIANRWATNLPPAGGVTDSLGSTWTFVAASSTGPLGDLAGFPTGLWYTVLPTTSSSDTITVNIPGSTFTVVDGLLYSGLGSIEPSIAIGAGFGGPEGLGNALSGNYATSAGDLNISCVAGAPTLPGTGWTERNQDMSRPFTMCADQVAASSTSSSTFLMNNEGYLIFSIAFRPAGGGPVSAVAWTSPAAPCWAAANPQIGVPWDTTGHHTNQLFAIGSTGTGLTYLWTQSSGPAVTITNPTGITTTVTDPGGGPVTAGYRVMHLRVTDSMSNTSQVDLDVGAIGIDPNGAVIPTDPNVTKLFGPMIALGYNPWCFADERAVTAATLQTANNTYYSSMAALWSVTGQGTVAYQYAGIGMGLGGSPAGATLNGGITATATSIAIHNAQNLPGLLSLPTWLMIGGSQGELIRVTATTATTGDANLTIGYDGRNVSGNPFALQPLSGGQAWSGGTLVGEMRLKGTGTLFLTDPSRNICPAGFGPPGPIVYSTGTVRLAASSPTITGTSTGWIAGTNIPLDPNTGSVSGTVRVHATHASGTPFIFFARITVVGGVTSLTVSRNAPADVDTATDFAYEIIGARYLSLEFSDAAAPLYGAGNQGIYRSIENAMGCESETVAFATPAYDTSTLYSLQSQTGMKYSYKNGLGCCSAFGDNFYGTGAGDRATGLRSGINPWITAANLIDDYWIRDPELMSGLHTGSPLYLFGGYFGGVANLVLNPGTTPLKWSDVRPWASTGKGFMDTYHATCNNALGYDTRDQAGELEYLTLPSIWDPDPTNRNVWLVGMGSGGAGAGALGRATNVCQHADHSYAVGLIVPTTLAAQAPNRVIGLTTNSKNVTGTGFTSNMCAGIATGTVTVTHGSATFTFNTIVGALGSNPHYPANPQNGENYNIIIHDTSTTPNYSGVFAFVYTGTAGTLNGLWPGGNGMFSYLVQDNRQGVAPGAGNIFGGMTAIGSANTDADNLLQSETWGCTFVSSTQFTLNRNWDDADTGGSIHPTGTFYMIDSGNFGVGVAGYYEQPFMHGVNTRIMAFAAYNSPDPTIANGFQALLPGASQWFHDIGFDQNTLGSYYTRVSLACEPFVTATSSPTFLSIHGAGATTNCGYSGLLGIPPDGNGDSEQPERVNTAEASADFIEYFNTQCLLGPIQCTAARAFGDQAYGAMWGKCAWTTPGYYCDSRYLNITGETSNGSIGAFKWSGFFFGMGMTHQWPAVRLNGAGSSSRQRETGNVQPVGGVHIH